MMTNVFIISIYISIDGLFFSSVSMYLNVYSFFYKMVTFITGYLHLDYPGSCFVQLYFFFTNLLTLWYQRTNLLLSCRGNG